MNFQLIRPKLKDFISHYFTRLNIYEYHSRWSNRGKDVSKAPYKALFNPSLSSIRLWKIVQIHRAIEDQLKVEKRNRQGRESMLCVHGNRFLARQVFKKLSIFNLDDPKQSIQDIINLIPEYTVSKINFTITAILEKYPDSYLANLFRNKTKCQDIESFLDENS